MCRRDIVQRSSTGVVSLQLCCCKKFLPRVKWRGSSIYMHVLHRGNTNRSFLINCHLLVGCPGTLHWALARLSYTCGIHTQGALTPRATVSCNAMVTSRLGCIALLDDHHVLKITEDCALPTSTWLMMPI